MQIPEHILEGCRQHDRQAQQELYNLCYKPLMRIAMRYTFNQPDAADILNRTMFKALTRIGMFNGKALNFFAWLRQILVNESLDHIRSRHSKTDFEPLTDDYGNISVMVDDQSDTDDITIKMLRKLPPVMATVFNLFALEGYSHREIGRMLGISESNSKWHLHAARQRLQQWIRQSKLI